MVQYVQGNVIKKTVLAILMLLIGISMGDVVVTTVTAVNTTGWAFTGYTAIIQVLNLIPLMYYGGVVVGAALAFLVIK